VASEEKGFSASLNDLVALADKHGRAVFRDIVESPDGLRLVARTKVKTLAAGLSISLDESALEAATARLVEAFPIPFHFLRDLLSDLLHSQMDLDASRNRNSAWDLKLAFHACPEASVGGVPVLLVSNDPRIRRAAASAGTPYRVATREEYEHLLRDITEMSRRLELLSRTA
jgi:hypothetical protein